MSLDLTAPAPTPPANPAEPAAVPTADNARADTRFAARMTALRPATLAAVRRDLDRLTRVVAEPVTAVRRTALVSQVGYLVDRLRAADPELAGRHAGPLSRLRHEARCWSREPGRRPALLAATEQVAMALAPTIDADRPDVQVTTVVAGAGSNRISIRQLPARWPTTLAYHYFWLLDDRPHAADLLAREFTAPARWVLRNVLSGGYNRRSHLMWEGGGSGPAS